MEDYERIKADLPECDLFGCNKIGVLVFWVSDTVTKQTQTGYKRAGCKTHMLKYLLIIARPRYSKKRVQALATTEAMQFERPLTDGLRGGIRAPKAERPLVKPPPKSNVIKRPEKKEVREVKVKGTVEVKVEGKCYIGDPLFRMPPGEWEKKRKKKE